MNAFRKIFSLEKWFARSVLPIFLVDYLPIILPDRIRGYNAAHAGGGVNVAIPADDCTGIANSITADLNIVAYHRTELFDTGLELFAAVTNDNIFLSDFTFDVIEPAPMWLK